MIDLDGESFMLNIGNFTDLTPDVPQDKNGRPKGARVSNFCPEL